MHEHKSIAIDLPVITDVSQFDYRSGGALERLVFNHRPLVLLLVTLVTLLLVPCMYSLIKEIGRGPWGREER